MVVKKIIIWVTIDFLSASTSPLITSLIKIKEHSHQMFFSFFTPFCLKSGSSLLYVKTTGNQQFLKKVSHEHFFEALSMYLHDFMQCATDKLLLENKSM